MLLPYQKGKILRVNSFPKVLVKPHRSPSRLKRIKNHTGPVSLPCSSLVVSAPTSDPEPLFPGPEKSQAEADLSANAELLCQLKQLNTRTREQINEYYSDKARICINQAVLLLERTRQGRFTPELAKTIKATLELWFSLCQKQVLTGTDTDDLLGNLMIRSSHSGNGYQQLNPEYLASSISCLQKTIVASNCDSFRYASHLVALYSGCTDLQDQSYFLATVWINHWPVADWFQFAPETLVITLSNCCLVSSADPAVPPYSKTLDLLLYNCNPEMKCVIQWLVAASAAPSLASQEKLLQQAVLTGYSHPLPYLELIRNLVLQKRCGDAHHIYEMYRLAVLSNCTWSNPSSACSGPDYDRACERYRLEQLFSDELKTMKKEVYTRDSRHQPSRGSLNTCLQKYWPLNLRGQAEDVMLIQTLATNWNIRKPILKFTEAVMARAADRWQAEGVLKKRVGSIQAYIEKAYVRRALDTLCAQQAQLLVKMGEWQEAIHLLHDFIDRHKDGVGTDFDLTLYLIATAVQLKALGAPVIIPDYDSAMKLVGAIMASGNKEKLGKCLQQIRAAVSATDCNLKELTSLYRTIPDQMILIMY